MTDYTPTTEEVRELFTNGISRHLTYAGAEFDRWLAEVKAEAWAEGMTAAFGEEDYCCNPYREQHD